MLNKTRYIRALWVAIPMVLIGLFSCNTGEPDLREINLREYYYSADCDTLITKMNFFIKSKERKIMDTVPTYFYNRCEQFGDAYMIISEEYFPSFLPKNYYKYEYGRCYGRIVEGIDYFYPVDEKVINLKVKVKRDTLYDCSGDSLFAHYERTSLRMADSAPKENQYITTRVRSNVLGIETIEHKGQSYECLVVEEFGVYEYRAYNQVLVEYDTSRNVAYYAKGLGLLKASGGFWKNDSMWFELDKVLTPYEFDSIRAVTDPMDWLNRQLPE